MSGRGAPSRTATPMPTRAMSARLPATTSPCPASCSMTVSVSTTTSAGSPPASRLLWAPAVSNVIDSVWPVSCLNASPSSVTRLRIAPALSTLISAAAAESMPAASSSALLTSQTARPIVFMPWLLLEDVVEARLERLAVFFDLLVVHRHQLDLRQGRIAGWRRHVRAGGVDALAGEQLLHGVADHELGEGLGRVRMRT